MEDGLDFLSAMRAVRRAMPEEAKVIQKYIDTLTLQVPRFNEKTNEDKESTSK